MTARVRSVLAIALALQLLLAGALWAFRLADDAIPDPFLTFDASSVDAIVVSDGENTITVSRIDDVWRLDGGLPADGDKMESMLEKLSDANGGWPVASSTSTARRFEVTEDKFQRRITVNAGDVEIADVFLGTSPGYRKVHARHRGADDVYSIEFSNFEAGIDLSWWLKKSLLQPSGELAALQRPGRWRLDAGEEGWSVAQGPGVDPLGGQLGELGQQLDQQKVETFVRRFTGLNVLGVLDTALPGEPSFSFLLTDDDGVQALKFFHLDEQDSYAATSDRVAGVFEVAAYIAEQMDGDLADLAPDSEPDEAEL
ncbi:MAG: DUF4340 domain-containing protein [Gammaproteobacteria bacterium]|nr:DUF4340 domain-containing protein [Gammaproteobacteria bacterium]